MTEYKKYELNDDVTLQVVSYTDEMLVARLWFSGKGFDDPEHSHFNQEVDTVISGTFAATNDGEASTLTAGESVHVRSNDKHGLQCLTPTGEICACWMPARKDLIEKFTELAE